MFMLIEETHQVKLGFCFRLPLVPALSKRSFLCAFTRICLWVNPIRYGSSMYMLCNVWMWDVWRGRQLE